VCLRDLGRYLHHPFFPLLHPGRVGWRSEQADDDQGYQAGDHAANNPMIGFVAERPSRMSPTITAMELRIIESTAPRAVALFQKRATITGSTMACESRS